MFKLLIDFRDKNKKYTNTPIKKEYKILKK